MNSTVPSRKTKIVLADYPYRRDIENRLFLSHLKVIEVDILKEILHSSLTISIHHLAETVHVSMQDILPFLDRLSTTKLIKHNGQTLFVDKEMRKYYEFQIEKFDEDFIPDLTFLQNLLNKVPIHVLPAWYVIPRSSDNIFASLIEKYFLTPQVYRQYLEELSFDDPLLSQIMKDVFQAPGLQLSASAIRERYQLSRERFEELILQLEYYFICCLSYVKTQDKWEEIVTPFHEWREYLAFEASTKPKVITDLAAIEKTCLQDFGFVKEMNAVLLACRNKNVAKTGLNPVHLHTKQELELVFNKLLQVEFLKDNSSGIMATEQGLLWLNKSLNHQIHALAAHPRNRFHSPASFWNSRNLRLIEKSLKCLRSNEWVYMEEFLKGMTIPFGEREPITLKNKGKKWRYALPNYQPEELAFMHSFIMEYLYELGIVATGRHQDRLCFCLTSFGQQFIH